MIDFTKDKVRKYFSHVADNYLRAYDKDLYFQSIQSYIFQERERYILNYFNKDEGKVLDIGCGPGVIVRELLDRGCDVWAVDISQKMIEQARKIVKASRNFKKAVLLVGDVEHLSFPDNFFDSVLCVGVLEYLTDHELALKEMARVLKPNGELIVTVPNKMSPFNIVDRFLVACLRIVFGIYRTLSSLMGVKVSCSKEKLSLRKDIPTKLYFKHSLERALSSQHLKIVENTYHIFRFAFLSRILPSIGIWLSQKKGVFESLHLQWMGVNYIAKAIKVSH